MGGAGSPLHRVTAKQQIDAREAHWAALDMEVAKLNLVSASRRLCLAKLEMLDHDVQLKIGPHIDSRYDLRSSRFGVTAADNYITMCDSNIVGKAAGGDVDWHQLMDWITATQGDGIEPRCELLEHERGATPETLYNNDQTLIIIKGGGCVFGGYADEPFNTDELQPTASGTVGNGGKAFLFVLKPMRTEPIRLLNQLNREPNAMVYEKERDLGNGPIFGIRELCIRYTEGERIVVGIPITGVQGVYTDPLAFSLSGLDAAETYNSFGRKEMEVTVDEIEVYKVETVLERVGMAQRKKLEAEAAQRAAQGAPQGAQAGNSGWTSSDED